METKNPAFNEKTLEKFRQAGTLGSTETMTLDGSINKVGFLVVLTVLSSAFGWSLATSEGGPGLAIGAVIVNFIVALVIIFKKETAPILAPIYALIEGLALGFISFFANVATKGIVLNAVMLTFAILFGMLFLYKLNILRATETFKKVVMLAMFAIVATYLIDMVLMMFHHSVLFIHEASPYGILFSAAVVVVASLSFIMDFDMVERAVQARAPKYMEWYAGFSVLLTLIWLYLEILRLLSKLNSRR